MATTQPKVDFNVNPGTIFQKALDDYKKTLENATMQYQKILADSQAHMEKMLEEASALTKIPEPEPEQPQLPPEIVITGDDVKTFIQALDSLLNGIMHLKDSFGIK